MSALTPLESGTPQNAYREFTYVVPAGTRQRIFYSTTYFRIMSLTLNTLSVNFAGTTDTTIVGAGIGIKMKAAVPYVDLINTGGADLTVTVALGCVEINDSRLNLTGSVNSVIVSGATLVTVADVTLTHGVATKIITGNANNKSVIISNLLASAAVIRVGDLNVTATRGAEVPIGGSITLDCSADIWGFNNTGGDFGVGVAIVRI